MNPNVLEPAPEGTPLTFPDDDNASPAGNDPAESVQTYGGTPPVRPVIDARDAEYVNPTCAFGSTTGEFIVSDAGVHVIEIESAEPMVRFVIAAVSVPVSVCVAAL